MKTYDEGTLKKLQKLECAMLRDFTRLCEKENVRYYMAFGSALGILRHGGFVPWDDDIDICMLRPDYERFAALVKSGALGENYELISAVESDDYLMPEAHLQLKGTRFVDKPSLGYRQAPGIFLDLFIMDKAAPGMRERKKQIRDTILWGKLMIIYSIPHPLVPWKGLPGALASAVLFLLHYLLRLLPLNPRKMFQRYTEASTRFNDGLPEGEYTNFRSPEVNEIMLRYEQMFPVKEALFEGIPVCLNSEPEQALEKLYGDYMTLPPEEKRHNHVPEILDFGDALQRFGIEE